MSEDHKEYMLAVLRVASSRCKLWDNEIAAIGTALRTDMICPDIAVKWVNDAGLMWMIEPLPFASSATVLPSVPEVTNNGK